MNKIKAGVLGATGTVGQRFIQLLENHPFFEVTELCASEKSSGKNYEDSVSGRWKISADIPSYARKIKVKDCKPPLDCKLLFSGLDSSVAGPIEEDLAGLGYIVVSNSKNHRWDRHVPLMSAEVNPEHLEVVKNQESYKKSGGFIITNSNCTIMGVTIVLKALMDKFGVEKVLLVSMQAISGAGYPGVASLDILGNIIPYIGGEEEKAEQEPLKILGKYEDDRIVNADILISAHCNRVPVIDGHLCCISVKLNKKASIEEIIRVLQDFKGEPQRLKLPLAPEHPIIVKSEPDRPQSRVDLMEEKGMATVVGRIRLCPLLDVKMVILSHNTIRGAAGAALLNAELMYSKGYIKD
ncbi:MAG TPA: aspartate-semialdehyde dehydrogenase [Candidatus Eremiobacteraeota bacterium]|nr:MAG: Aspartate-semialdehyde dehydrogenase 2 [bacterium ADurb.Bin363]HPZ09585.1 aspartate-semialdehyde dehydrogenase [Candidatus Eremiobacteraeota bacterium]